jgi:hypothetical protein
MICCDADLFVFNDGNIFKQSHRRCLLLVCISTLFILCVLIMMRRKQLLRTLRHIAITRWHSKTSFPFPPSPCYRQCPRKPLSYSLLKFPSTKEPPDPLAHRAESTNPH